jgi:hypothetical protein
MLRDEVMASRYVGNHRTRCDRLSDDPPLLLVAPPPAADDARDLRPPPNNLRVVTDVDHNVHTIRDPERIANMHARSTLRYVRSKHRLRPNEGFGVGVGIGDEAVDGELQVNDGLEYAALEPLARELGEKPFDRVESGCRGGGEVEGPARMSRFALVSSPQFLLS